MQEADIDEQKDPENNLNLLFFQSGINKEVADLEQIFTNKQEYYVYKSNQIAVKLKNYLCHFINVNCYDEISNFIITLPKSQLINLNFSLNDMNGDCSLDFSKIKMILEDQENKILFPSIIPIAIKLNIGNFKATYEVHRLDCASFKDTLSTEGELIFTCKLQYPLVRYLVTLIYEIVEINITIPLITLYFENKLKIKYSLVHMDDIFEYAAESIKYVNEINTKPIKEYVKDFWKDGIFIKEKSIIHEYPNINLNKLTNYAVDSILSNNYLECKRIKEKLLNEHYDFYFSKLNRIFIGYQNIVTYAKFAGLDKEKIDLISGYFDSKEFIEDIINLPLVDYNRGTYKVTLLSKYINCLDTAISYINPLIALDNNEIKPNVEILDNSIISDDPEPDFVEAIKEEVALKNDHSRASPRPNL